MAPDFDTLIVIAEIGIAYVAFSTIVAALQPIRGKPFTHYQVLLVHFYLESGTLNVGFAILPLVLWHYFHDELMVWRVATAILVPIIIIYMIYYLMRRKHVRAPTFIPSLMVMVGHAIAVVLMIITLTEKFWLPSMATYATYLFWGFASSSLIFLYFFDSFIRRSGGSMKR